MAQVLGTYLSLYAEINGKGSEVAFPGTELSGKALSNGSSQDMVAKASIIASLKPEQTTGQRYNTADNAQPSSWSKKWPIICEYFWLKGVGPSPAPGPQAEKYCADHFAEWQALGKNYGLKTGRVGNNRSHGMFSHFIMSKFHFDRQLDTSKCYDMMGDKVEQLDVQCAWYTALNRFREAKIIP
ncbi:hypothetical protein F5Y16DRAFT_379841 [Xylariaceae sp. FL0255]|nr:hypothetical protein F5Y16DRAFT_379841 [Xylariaceae sp. FL0255]